jgi:hypothetical protein
MKKLFFFALALSLFVPLGMAQTENDVNMMNGFTAANKDRALGSSLWSTSVEGATASVYNLGVEFDGTSYWVTVGAPAGGSCFFVTMDQAGNLVNSFPQPVGTDNSWGIRDLAFDASSNRLYGGCDAWNPSYIDEFKKVDGSFTNIKYGPFLDPSMTVTRACAYDSNNDCFYAANWASPVFKCSKTNNVTQLMAGTGLSCYGAACEESTAATKLWLWWYDGAGDHGTEIDVNTKTYTGAMFDGGAGNTAGGACAYDAGGGNWNLVAMHQASPDTIEAFDLATVTQALEVNVASIDAHVGGTATFSLANGPANRDYLIWASMTNGLFLLPGGLPLGFAWDSITTTFLTTTIAGNPLTPFLGTLDGAGAGSAVLTIPGHTSPPLMEDLPLMFVYSTYDPFDFVSNIVDVLIVAYVAPPPGYQYDDGSTEDALGWSAGGHTMWGHCFDASGSDTITTVDVAFGWNGGTTVLDGLAAEIFVLEDPNDDCNPVDAVAVHTINTVIANANSDTFMHFDGFSAPVSGKFFVAVHVDLGVTGGFAAGMDTTSGYTTNDSWFTNAADVAGLGAATIYEMSAIGFPYHWMIRANL